MNRTAGGTTEDVSFDLLDPMLRPPLDCHTADGSGTVCASPMGPGGTGMTLSDAGNGPPSGDENPTNFYQGSQNPVFGFYATFAGGFDFDQEATYGFRLVALSQGGDLASRTMCVNVSTGGTDTTACEPFDPVQVDAKVPAPAPLGLLLLGAGVLVRRCTFERRLAA